MYSRSTAETTMNRIGQNIPVICLHLEATTNTRGEAAVDCDKLARAPWPVRVYAALSSAQATMLDPIQMGLRIIRLAVCVFFMIEHRSLPIVRLQETRVIQIFGSRFCERASIRSPPGNHLCPTFFSRSGDVRRSDHFGSDPGRN